MLYWNVEVFDDSHVSNDTTLTDLPRVAAATGCSLIGRVLRSANVDSTMHACAVLQRSGNKISNMYSTDE